MFCLQRSGESSREQLAIINASRKLGYSYCFADACKEGMIPIGDVPFCEAAFGPQGGIKEFYPGFLSSCVSRRIEIGFLDDFVHMKRSAKSVFLKSAWHWKAPWPSRVYLASGKWPDSLMYCSAVVEFTNEWRYYVADGEVVTTGWYQGEDEDMPAPSLNVAWPAGFSGAVDFGTLQDGAIELVEAHAPFACGWYGEDSELYALWQAVAWENSSFWKRNEQSR